MNCVEYTPDMGKINLTDEMIAKLKGLPIDEQAKWFGIVRSESEEKSSYGQSDGERMATYGQDVDECSYAKSWIIKDGIIVGVVFSNWASRLENHFLNSWCNTYFCFDDDGTGSTDVSVHCKLVWRGC